jgi:hypothetical protein
LLSNIQMRASDESIVDGLEGAFIWESDTLPWSQTMVQLYRRLPTNLLIGSTTFIEHKDKYQAAGLKLAETINVFGHIAYKTHIKSIAVSVHGDNRVEVVGGNFTNKRSDVDMTRVESVLSYLNIKTSMTMREKLRQVSSTIYVNRIEIAHTRLEAVAEMDYPNSAKAIFGIGYLAIKKDQLSM